MTRLHVSMLLIAVCACAGCATPVATDAAGPASVGAWSAGQTSIAYLPAPGTSAPTTVLTTAPGSGPPTEGPLQQVRPGEVWCKVVRPATYRDRVERMPTGAPRWEWRRTTECDVPGAATPAAAGGTIDQAVPGQVWCYVQVEPAYETRTTRVLLCPERVEWRRTSECEVPQP